MKKEIYESPELEITAYETEDVITASGLGDNEHWVDWGDIWG